MGFIKDKKKQISKSFTLYAVEGGGSGGIVTLKLVRCAAHCASRHARSGRRSPAACAELHSQGGQRAAGRARARGGAGGCG